MKPYNVTRILNEDSTINLDAYHSYSPLFISFVLTPTSLFYPLLSLIAERRLQFPTGGSIFCSACHGTISNTLSDCHLRLSQVVDTRYRVIGN